MTIGRRLLFFLLVQLSVCMPVRAAFNHPGGLHTLDDLDRMKAKVLSNTSPWIDGWNLLIADSRAQRNWVANPTGYTTVGGKAGERQRAQKDAVAAYYNTLRWYVTGDASYADCAVRILNTWSNSITSVVTGELFQLPIPPMVQAAELLRLYPGWSSADIDKFKYMCLNYFYPACHSFIGTCNSWPGWDGPAANAILAIGVFCDDQAKFDEGVDYFKNGAGGGCILHNVINADGQLSEMGRDIPHAEIGIAYAADACQIAWNQGIDLYGYANNRLLAGFEYFSKSNLNNPVNWVYDRSNCIIAGKLFYYPALNSDGYRIYDQPIFEMVYNHYLSQGIPAPYTRKMVNLRGMKGTISELNLGYVALTYTLSDTTTIFVPRPLTPPTNLTAKPGMSSIQLSWTPPSGDVASGYDVLRSTTSGGAYSTINSAIERTANNYNDTMVTNGVTYYYKVQARNLASVSAVSNEASATSVAGNTGLPEGWSRTDLGTVAAAGTTLYAKTNNQTYTLTGSGDGFGSKTDNACFAYRQVTGDFVLTARLSAYTLAGWDADRVGLMMRESVTDAGAKSVSIGIHDSGFRVVWLATRSATGSTASWKAGDTHTCKPSWFRLQRKGNLFVGYQSLDGNTWFAADSSSVTMATSYYVGMFATSDSPTASQLTTVTFDNLSAEASLTTGTKTIGASGADYASIREAIIDINAGGGVGTGGVVLELQSDYAGDNEILVPVAGASASSPVLVRPASGVGSLSISSTTAEPGLFLNGCGFVTIDGRAGGVGSSVLTIQNSNVGASPALQMGNSSMNNVVKYVTIKSSNNSTSSGSVVFGTDASYNKIDQCTITDYSAVAPPAIGVYCNATAIQDTISNTTVSNFYYSSTTSNLFGGNGINLGGSTSAWVLSGNSFYNNDNGAYNTASTWPMVTPVYINTSGDGFIVSGNYIGGTQPRCGGTPWQIGITPTATRSTGPVLHGIYFKAGTTNRSILSSNTIQNIVINTGVTNSNGDLFGSREFLIDVDGGKVDVTNNTIGSQNVLGSITLNFCTSNGSNNNLYFFGIQATSASGDVNVSGNTVGGITFQAASYLNFITGNTQARPRVFFFGVGVKGSRTSGTVTISDNTIGKDETGITDGTLMSIQNFITFTNGTIGYFSDLTFGIYSDATTGSTVVIDGNRIANLFGSNVIWAGLRGIAAVNAPTSITISNNRIHDLLGGAPTDATSGNDRWSSGGIYYTCTTSKASALIKGNTVYNLSTLNGISGVVNDGIYINSTGGATLAGNSIFNIVPAANSGTFYPATTGIRLSYSASNSDIFNNSIRLGYNKTGALISGNYYLYGVKEDAATASNYYHNSVLIAGTSTGTATSFALRSSVTPTAARGIKNNLFINKRVGSGKQFVLELSSLNNTTLNYNDYLASNGYFGYYTSDRLTFANWQTATGQDANSKNVEPVFVHAASAIADLHLNQPDAANNPLIAGTPLASVTTDADGQARSSVPTMGADEYTSYQWAGTQSTAWSTAGNWVDGLVPNTSTVDVALPSALTNYPVVTDSRTVKSITIAPGAALTNNNGTLTAASLTLQSNAGGTGTFVDRGNSSIAEAHIQQYLTPGRNWYLSSPVNGTIVDSINELTGTYLARYDESHGSTIPWVTETTTMKSGQGYVVVAPVSSECTIDFVGSPFTGNLTIPLTRTSGQTKEGFNLIGNPYASYVDWNSAVKTNVEPTIWYRTRNTAMTPAYVFDTYNATSQLGTNNNLSGEVTGFIPPMQAVWTRVSTGQSSGSVLFSNSMRSHASGTTTKLKAARVMQVIRLQVSANGNSDEAILAFSPDASNGLDAFDSYKMSNGNALVPEIFTQVGTQELAINGMAEPVSGKVLALGFRTGQKGAFTLKAKSLVNLEEGTKLQLLDKLTGVQSDLSDGSDYAFVSDIATTLDRFSLIIGSANQSTGIDQLSASNAVAYRTTDNRIAIELSAEAAQHATATVYDLAGRRLASQKLTGTSNVLDIKLASGTYLVFLKTVEKTMMHVVVLN
jgi:regulation of enolase protein 1 (concanavalin A-like superfamily)